ADFVADSRAPTPSAAAEMISPDGDRLQARLDRQHTALGRAMTRRLAHWRQHLDWLRKRLRGPADLLREQSQHLDHLEIRLHNATSRQLARRQERFERLSSQLLAISPAQRYAVLGLRLESLAARLRQAQREQLNRHNERLRSLAATLNAVSPLATLERGYSIARKADGQVVKSVAAVATGETLDLMLADGSLQCVVEGKTDPTPVLPRRPV
ncbi:MAG: hypothetical protein M0R02_13880, partial [Bacteroidales bacterium]|nr:hypothetical protein [Bacteroidales bacterium]